MEKHGPLDVASPPPYQLPAYSHQRRRRRLLVRGPVSVRTVLTFVLTASVVWLCLAFSRETRWRQHGDDASSVLMEQFDEAVAQCRAIRKQVLQPSPESRQENPRWIASRGQQKEVVLKNAKLFDGETFMDGLVDISFSKGLIRSVSKAGEKTFAIDAVVHDVNGRYVTPGLVDMHSHHFVMPWPSTGMNMDFSETHPETGSLTPQVRILDGLKPYDIAATIICSGGVTSSMVIPGSANIIGGEGTAVKNVLYSGKHSEPVVDDLLLERGIPVDERRRYMKMAFGENPKRVWGYSRLGTSWHLRKQMQRGKDLKEKQDEYCHSVDQARVQGWDGSRKARLIADRGKFPFELELESTVALLRGKVALHNHNYEPEDMQAMLRISREFGYKVKAFHHATAAWQIPHLLREEAENITIAIFAEFSLYKAEAYFPSLAAASVLTKHGIDVAFKSDHSGRDLNSKYLASQAAVGHSFHLPEDEALQSITSIPAKAMDQGHRIGYCRKGYDADIAVWDAHPLEVGATPLQVFVDGQPQLDNDVVKKSTGQVFDEKLPSTAAQVSPTMRAEGTKDLKASCAKANGVANVIITGIKKTFVDNNSRLAAKDSGSDSLELIIKNGEVACFGAEDTCQKAKLHVQGVENHVSFSLANGHISRGLTAVTNALGMHEIVTESNSGDGDARGQNLNDPDTVVFAKHGVHLDGKEFARARLGGVTRAVTGAVTELDDVQGVTVEILTSGKKSLLHGGIVQDEVSFRLALGEPTFAAHGSISRGVETLRRMLQDGQGKSNSTVYGRVARGELPLVVRCQNKYDIEQLVMVKRDHPSINLVIFGGQEAASVSATVDLTAATWAVS